MMDAHQKAVTAAVLLIIGLAVGFWLGRTAERGMLPQVGQLVPPPAPGATGPPPTQGAVFIGGNAIAVNDQPPGMKVAIAMVAFARDGWVVIHEDSDGKPGRILGAQRFGAGPNQSGSVDLLRPIEGGRFYFAMLHSDDGDRQFDHTKDLPVTNPEGNAILMRFVTTTEPGER